MRKKRGVCFPNLKRPDSCEVVSCEEYMDQLNELYASRDVRKEFLNQITFSVPYRVWDSVGSTVGRYDNAVESIEAARQLSRLSIEEMRLWYRESPQARTVYNLAILLKGESDDTTRLILENRLGIRPCEDKIIELAKEITIKVLNDVEKATRERLTFVEKLSLKSRMPDESRVSWANRVSADSDPAETRKATTTTKKISFAEELS